MPRPAFRHPLAFALALGLLCACTRPGPAPSLAEPVLTSCADPRPRMCTREYRPVCASRDTGVRCITTPCPSEEWKTYGNACDACADPKVYGHKPGECN